VVDRIPHDEERSHRRPGRADADDAERGDAQPAAA
jgi:hypothetical protein